jgi:hypothetical protein
MAHHVQFSYSKILNVEELLDHLKTLVKKYQPEHIAVGILAEKTHVYMELVEPIRLQSLARNFLRFQDTNAEMKKRVKNYLSFQRMFTQLKEENKIIHFRRAAANVPNNNDEHQIEEFKVANDQLRNEIKRLQSRNIFLQKSLKDQRKISSDQNIIHLEQIKSLEQLVQNLEQEEFRRIAKLKQEKVLDPRATPHALMEKERRRNKKLKKEDASNAAEEEDPAVVEDEEEDVDLPSKRATTPKQKKNKKRVISDENILRNTDASRQKRKPPQEKQNKNKILQGICAFLGIFGPSTA